MKHLLLLFYLLSCSFLVYSQTLYGITGLLRIPTAHIIEDGKASSGYLHFRDYTGEGDLHEQFSIHFSLGLTSRLELTARLVGFPGIDGGDNDIYGIPFDRMLSGKLVILFQDGWWPQVSVGIQDAVGTRRQHSIYLVASRDYTPFTGFRLEASAGYGSRAIGLVTEEARGYAYNGPFGGLEASWKNRIFLMGEYDASTLNVGLRLAPLRWLLLQGFLLDGRRPVAGLALSFPL